MWFFSRSNQCTGNGGNKGSETILTKKNRATPQKNTLSSIELPNVSAHSQVAEGEGGNPAHTLVFGAGDGKQVTFLNETKERFGILVVDDHPVMRDGLRAVIEQESDMEVTGEAADGKDAIEQFRKLLPDVMLIDLQMPVMDGLQAITTIRSEFPDATIIVLTTFPGDARVVRAFTLGATSYLLKTARREEIIKAIRSALTGRHIVAPEVAQEIASHAGREGLTDREIVVLSLVAQGRSNRHIAEALNITEDTVKARMKSIMAKLGAEDRTHAVMIAVKRGFLDSLP